ncbi:MAG: [FeFe] hydrogenase H-cluster maturation GTPase HydF [Bacteroides sp.]|nr:[FeFe] hydrogenase H-cluster maturation GTPase HydF [Bacteroides sp.]
MKNRQPLHIALFGKRNQGKSSLMNLLTGQQTSIVSETPGTTADPVKKSCELFGLGNCVLIDTAGFDDTGELGGRRAAKAFAAVQGLDAALLVISDNTFAADEQAFADGLKKEDVPFLILHNKADRKPLSSALRAMLQARYPECGVLDFSVALAEEKLRKQREKGYDAVVEIVEKLRELMARNTPDTPSVLALQGLVKPGDRVVLVCPIDAEAPKDRLILPQVMLARQCLDFHAVPVLCRVEELPGVMASLPSAPALVITDSQAFAQVEELLPDSQPLTGFSICLARQKGGFDTYLHGTRQLDKLADGQKILMLESCTHQVNCHDIGRVKLPAAIRRKSGKELEFCFVSGNDPLPEDLSGFALAVQCGGCMATGRQLAQRVKTLRDAGLPVANYGMALAWASGIFERATRVFVRES